MILLVLRRGIPWPTVVIATAASLGPPLASTMVQGAPPLLATLAVVALATTAAQLLDEPAAAVVDACPPSLRCRTLIRALALPLPASAGWVGASLAGTPPSNVALALGGGFITGLAARRAAAPSDTAAALAAATALTAAVVGPPIWLRMDLPAVEPAHTWMATLSAAVICWRLTAHR